MIVDRAFQMQYVLIWVWVGLGIVATMAVFYFVVVRLYAQNPVIQPMMTRVMGGLALCIVTFCALMGLITTRLTHRVAGAAFNLQRAVDRIHRNKFDEVVRLRPDDYLQGLARLLDELRTSLQVRRAEALAALQALTEIQPTLSGDARTRADQAIAKLKSMTEVVDVTGAHPPVSPA